MANSNLPRRIIKETQRLLSESAPGISASPSEDNMCYFSAMILGPAQSSYEDYPMATPKVPIILHSLLSTPNPDDPLSESIAKHRKTNEAEAVETAKEWT